MASPCVASSKLALPSVLQSLFRAEFASELRSQDSFYNRARPLSLRRASLPSRGFQSKRAITTSLPRSQEFQSEQPPSSSTEPSSATDNSSPSQFDHVVESALEDKVKHSENSKRRTESSRTPPDTKSKSQKPPSMLQQLQQSQQKKKKREGWQIQKDALKGKFKEGWNPTKKLSPDALDGIRHLHAMAPDRFTTPVLAEQFKVSPEAVRRILKSKWKASETEMDDRRKRWEKRHDRIWSQMAELGLRPKRKRTQEIDDSKVLYEDDGS
ncbi:mitochondrial ribosome assembly protein RRG9 [Aspergillus glaucus CBS 516.65]|uniref:Required for respiratory growth protein 9, mitochondrial n=1 Tax=Aspergillus glaucus CBS 516.65 TaxID=1160497 RepID=A0A1L9V9B3_ASPGL|nr:hypothetical protein ASPGLDRAFT_51358 [Aspergillus glaucus CBS 516.65]OJJ80524.1 hypothetical protein ASPGLDRAFT_51358 [Aspergillus glaucus CBS 516.65]